MSPEQIGVAMHDQLGHYLAFELPKLKTSLGLNGRDSDKQIEAEWELTVFISFCLVQAVAHAIEDDTRRQQILTAFFKAAAGEQNLKEFIAAMQPRFDEYEQALFSLKPEQVAFEAAGMLHDRIFPGEASDGARLQVLSKLFPLMDSACKKVLDAA